MQNTKIKQGSLIDISVPLKNDMPTWPGDRGFQLVTVKSISKGDTNNLSEIICGNHTGTHIDAPAHFLSDGISIEKISLEALVGEAYVAHLPDVKAITAKGLRSAKVPKGIERLLLRTSNSIMWAKENKEFNENFVALTKDAAQWIVDRRIKLVGVDYLSVQIYKDDPLTHTILLGAGVVVVEGLNLADVEEGLYDLTCLPLRIVGAEGSPARAILRKRNNKLL